jgi:Bacterial SH3 domain
VSGVRRACRVAAALLAADAAAGVARAETQYVIEQLVVTVNSAPDAGGERVASVKSGDPLEVLERVGAVVHVRLANGKDGWIGARYLSGDEPLRPRLAQRETEVAQLKEQVSRLQSELAAARASAAAAPAAGSSAANAAGAATAPNAANTANAASVAGAATTSTAEAGGSPVAPLFSGAADDTPPRLWPWTLGAALAGLFLGFALGALVLDRYIRRKYGGLRIY